MACAEVVELPTFSPFLVNVKPIDGAAQVSKSNFSLTLHWEVPKPRFLHTRTLIMAPNLASSMNHMLIKDCRVTRHHNRMNPNGIEIAFSRSQILQLPIVAVVSLFKPKLEALVAQTL